jgi:hypothetical protein
MAYVLDYTIIAAGLPYQSKGTDHASALYDFIEKPAGMACGYHQGRLSVSDGETIIVVGPTQESHRLYHWHNESIQRARQDVAKGGKGVVAARERLANLEATPVRSVEIVTIPFTMEATTRYRAVTPEEIVKRELVRSKLCAEIEDESEKGPIKLILNYERQSPMRRIHWGNPEEYTDDGIWLNNRLFPWMDIDGAEALTDDELRLLYGDDWTTDPQTDGIGPLTPSS